jgi:hypothetical protein
VPARERRGLRRHGVAASVRELAARRDLESSTRPVPRRQGPRRGQPIPASWVRRPAHRTRRARRSRPAHSGRSRRPTRRRPRRCLGRPCRRPDRVACVTPDDAPRPRGRALMTAFRRPIPDAESNRRCGHLLRDAKPPEAIGWLARRVDVVLVVGDPTSSNSRHLARRRQRRAHRSYLGRKGRGHRGLVAVRCEGGRRVRGRVHADDLVSQVVESPMAANACGADLQEHAGRGGAGRLRPGRSA